MNGQRKPDPIRTIHFVALGCPKNRVDTEVMAGIAVERGIEIVADPAAADAIVVATCGFIESASQESVDTLLELSRYRKHGRCQTLVAAGCLTQRHGQQLADALPEVDHLLGADRPDRIAAIFAGAARRVEVGAAGHFLQRPQTPRFTEPGAPSAYLKIADGCSRQCAFCAIPAIRGRMHSRPVSEIVDEATALVSRGVRELVLVSQDTSAYGRDLGDGTDLVRLVRALDRVPGAAWVRLLYLYPDAIPDELLEAIRELDRLVPYLDVPVQHASARMLRRMRRGHGPAALHKLFERARRIVPGVFLRTTVLVGHPGETADDFAALCAFVEDTRFEHLGAFRYSDEDGTPAFGTSPVVAPRDSYNRMRRVLALQRRISRQANRRLRGREIDVLVEGADDEQGFVLRGRHPGQAPEIDGVTYLVSSTARSGDIVRARVIRVGDFDLVAEPV